MEKNDEDYDDGFDEDPKPIRKQAPRKTSRRAPPKKKSPLDDPKTKILAVIVVITIVGIGFASMDDGPLDDGLEIWEDDDDDEGGNYGYTRDFNIGQRNFTPYGSNEFFILEVDYQLILEGDDDGDTIRVQITVLNETRMVNGIECAVYEEREWENGDLVEVSFNWLAFDQDSQSVFYFGEEVDDYENDVVVSHGGEWEAGVEGAKGGLLMPGMVLLGSAYYQEIAPGVAMDRAINVAVDQSLSTVAGDFTGCLKTGETNPLEDEEMEYKIYAPGVGLAQDEEAKLISYGYI